MSTVLAPRTWTRDGFLDWAAKQEERYEFDGHEPVAMNGDTYGHNQIVANIRLALGMALRGSHWRVLGQGFGVATTGSRVRFPDILLEPGPVNARARLASAPSMVVEVVSPSSGRLDRVIKVREYAAVPSILCYVVVESESDGVQVFTRTEGAAPWTASPLTAEDSFSLALSDAAPLSIPVAEFYAGVEFQA